jgi:uncharacterized protein (DUF2267 family)
MDTESFITIVEQAAGIGRERAERAIRATLTTLAERIAQGEARDLAEQLPPEVAPWLATTDGANRFGVDEFLRRVAEREGTDVPTAERHARAVFLALGRAVSRDELADLAAELPKSYAPLLPAGPRIEVLSVDTFLHRVADRAGLSEDAARRATDAVLETLAERIAGGDVEDLLARLPVELHEPLRRGRDRTGGKAQSMSLEEFERRVAEREDAGAAEVELEVRDRVRAVLTTLREAVGDDEFRDIRVQLPRQFDAVLAS